VSVSADAQVTEYPYNESFEGDPSNFTWGNIVATGSNDCGPWEYGTSNQTNQVAPSGAPLS